MHKMGSLNNLKVLTNSFIPVFLLILIFYTQESQAADLFVSLNGNDDNDCSSNAPCRTIKEAIEKANSGDTINVEAGTFEENSIEINKSLTIEGSGAGTTVDGTQSAPVFVIESDGNNSNNSEITVKLSSLTITNGKSTGPDVENQCGGICNGLNADLTITDCTIVDNNGSGISNFHKLTVSNTSILNNSSENQFGGGGIQVQDGVLDITDSTIMGNSAMDDQGFGGGGISISQSSATIRNTFISRNKANSSGGGISSGGDLTIVDSTIADNEAEFGGGIIQDGFLKMTGCTVSNNSASVNGGGISKPFELGDEFQVLNSTISGNKADKEGGGIFLDCSVNCNFIDPVGFQITNSTISNNTASDGGGIRNIEEVNPQILKGSIVASNSPNDCIGNITSNGFNIDSDGTCLSDPLSIGDKPNTPPAEIALGPLQNNGGPTETQALGKGSVAIDADTACPPPGSDQRGVKRPQGTACDIGAFEVKDTDSDGVLDNADTDSDNDGTTNDVEDSFGSNSSNRTLSQFARTDEIANSLDLDSDGDCICDILEAGGIDEDRDCVVDNFRDLDEDGLNDDQDPDQGGMELPLTDTDNDGTPDFLDPDSDNDGVSDTNETIGGRDVDGDGIFDDSEDLNADGLADSCHPATGTPLEFLDTDGDGIFDHLDSVDNTSGVGGGGCSIAQAGSTASIPLYLLVPALIVIIRLFRRFRIK